jgi:molybdopterin/thiamine biosynthesis adenylyltransferase
VGKPKVQAVADLIRQRNPKAEVETHQGRIEAHMDALDDIDILVVGVDGENAKYIINEACLERDLVAVYAGVYERGEGGDVVIIHPYDGPCYSCWAAELRDEIARSTAPVGELDYGMIGPEGTLEAEPGLWLHVVRVAAAQADMTLNELLRGTSVHRTMPGNTVILANTTMEIVEGQPSLPYTAVWATIPRDPHCLVCGDMLGLSDEHESALSLTDLIESSGIVMEQTEEDER